MKYGINEVMDCLEVAFDRKKILFQLAGIALSAAAVVLFSWLGGLAAPGLAANALNLTGAFVAAAIMAVFLTGISRMSYKELTVGEKISPKEALEFSKSNILSLLLTPVALAASAGAVFLLQYAIFLLGRFSLVQVVISVFSAPVLVLNAVMILFLGAASLFIYPVIAVDESGPFKSSRKVLTAVFYAPAKLLAGVTLSALMGIPVILSLAGLLFTANILTISMFGSASGIFEAMKHTEIPFIPATTYAAWSVFLVSLSVLSGAVLSYALVYTKTAAVSIYLSMKNSLK